GGGTLVGEKLNGEGRGVCAATDLVLFEVVRDGEGEGGAGEDGGVATAVAGSGEKKERRRGLLAAGGLRETWRLVVAREKRAEGWCSSMRERGEEEGGAAVGSFLGCWSAGEEKERRGRGSEVAGGIVREKKGSDG
ncbi:hypothetical protein HAX54_049405, partial [Datura stramonium]|nr:hypothetical protein [Datura stramonium]